MKSLIILLSLFSLQAIAVEGTGGSATTEKPSYRYPSDLSDEESQQMIMSRVKYDDCLKKETNKYIDKYEDFRKVADVAMEDCKSTLVEIDGDLEKMNLDPNFIRFFLHNTTQKSTQELLHEIMIRMSE